MNKSKYRGVHKNPYSYNNVNSSKWVVTITHGGKKSNLMYTDDEKEGARVYDKFAKYYHKDKAKLNFPEEV